MPKKQYSDEFKREVIEYALSTTKPVKQICREFGITTGSYYNWKKEILGDEVSDQRDSEGANAVSKEQMADEIRRLRKELAASQRREEILKKAAIILGEPPRNNMR